MRVRNQDVGAVSDIAEKLEPTQVAESKMMKIRRLPRFEVLGLPHPAPRLNFSILHTRKVEMCLTRTHEFFDFRGPIAIP